MRSSSRRHSNLLVKSVSGPVGSSYPVSAQYLRDLETPSLKPIPYNERLLIPCSEEYVNSDSDSNSMLYMICVKLLSVVGRPVRKGRPRTRVDEEGRHS